MHFEMKTSTFFFLPAKPIMQWWWKLILLNEILSFSE